MKTYKINHILQWIKVSLNFFLVVLIGFLDNLVGYEYDLHLLYLLPIGYIAWKINFFTGLILAIFSAIVWSISIKLLPIVQTSLFHIWSFVIKIVIFSTFSFLISVLKSKQNKLVKLSLMKEKFLSVASHDLKTPFSSIIGFSQLLLQENSLTDDQRHMVNMILKSSNIQLKYVNSIIELILSGSGKIKLDIEKKNISLILKNAVSSLKVLFDNKKIQIILNTPEKVEIYIDEAKIHQVVTNLVANAIKFSYSGGLITINCLEHKNYLEMHVIDTGIGISENNIKLIFSPSGIYPNKGTEGESGTGLGLAICQNIIALHNGKMGVVSELGKGSDFWFTLPLRTKK